MVGPWQVERHLRTATKIGRATRRATAVAAAAVLAAALGAAAQAPPEALSGYSATEVEPGVWRVDDDGFRELARPLDQIPPRAGIEAGLDGSVWLLRPNELIELGGEAVPLRKALRPRGFAFAEAAVGPDGTMWWTARGLHAYDGESWTTIRKAPRRGQVPTVAVEQDGTVLASLWQKGRTTLGRVEDGKLTSVGARLRGFGDRVTATPEGALVATGLSGDVWRYDGSSWWKLDLPAGDIQGVAFDEGEALWIRLARDVTDGPDGARTPVLARWDGDSWTLYGDAHGIPPSGSELGGFGRHVVAPDGSLWFPARAATGEPGLGCDGVASFDQRVVRHYLRDHCVHDLGVAPDGGVWLLASDQATLVDDERTEAAAIEVFHIPAET